MQEKIQFELGSLSLLSRHVQCVVCFLWSTCLQKHCPDVALMALHGQHPVSFDMWLLFCKEMQTLQ